MKLQELSNDLFADFKENEITNMQTIKGGGQETGETQGIVQGDYYCAKDVALVGVPGSKALVYADECVKM